MAAFEVIALDTATPQLRAPGASDTYTFPRAVEMPLGTANGVLFLNGSKVVTSGSALTFDGTNFTETTANGFSKFATNNATSSFNSGVGTYSVASATQSSRVAYLWLDADGGDFAGGDYSVVGKLGGGPALYGAYGTGAGHKFEIDGTEQMRLTSTGLGIGTSSPTFKLDVHGASGVGLRIYENSTGNNNRLQITQNGTVSTYNNTFSTGSGVHAWQIGNVEYMRLDSSGNLGLGVTPSATGASQTSLEVGQLAAIVSNPSGNTSTNVAQNAYYDGTNWKYRNTSVSAARYEMTGANSPGSTHAWYVAAGGTAGNAISFTQAMTLDASGNFGIGTTSPTSGFRLDVQATTARQRIESTTGTNQVEQRLTNTGGTLYLALDNSTGSGFGAAYGAALWHTGNYPMLFATNNTERARIPAAGGMVVGTAALATSATDGFLYVPTCAGTPTGTPTTQTGTAPIVVDTTNNKLYFYSGGQWRDAGP